MAKKQRRKSTGRTVAKHKARSPQAVVSTRLLGDIRSLIERARENTARAVNSALVELYWRIGKRIREDVLHEQRAEYGEAIVATLSQQLSWSHFRELLPLDDRLKRDFYAEMCRVERWSVRALRRKIDGLLYERTALSKKPQELIEQDLSALRSQDRMTPDLVFRDPYFLDFLGLTGTYSEHDIEQAILRELEAFILELGTDFAFVARQKRMTVDDEDYYLDLLFYHRRLRRLVAIDLKLGKFQAADKGQMELYLRWLEDHDVQPGEDAPLGLILCADKSEEHVRLLRLDESGIRVARYLTALPPRDVLETKLHQAIQVARERLQKQHATAEAPPALPDADTEARGSSRSSGKATTARSKRKNR